MTLYKAPSGSGLLVGPNGHPTSDVNCCECDGETPPCDFCFNVYWNGVEGTYTEDPTTAPACRGETLDWWVAPDEVKELWYWVVSGPTVQTIYVWFDQYGLFHYSSCNNCGDPNNCTVDDSPYTCEEIRGELDATYEYGVGYWLMDADVDGTGTELIAVDCDYPYPIPPAVVESEPAATKPVVSRPAVIKPVVSRPAADKLNQEQVKAIRFIFMTYKCHGQSYINKMQNSGLAWCKENTEIITSWIERVAKTRKKLDFDAEKVKNLLVLIFTSKED